VELLLCVIKNEAKSRQKKTTDKKTFLSFFREREQEKKPISLITQQKKMNALEWGDTEFRPTFFRSAKKVGRNRSIFFLQPPQKTENTTFKSGAVL